MQRESLLAAFKDWRVLAIIAVIVVAVVTARDWYYSDPQLTGKSTVYDYMTASVNRRIEWGNTMCNNGVCLTEKDWKCGFWPEDHTDATGGKDWGDVVKECFESIAQNAKPHERLHKLRQICGRRYMTFKGASQADISEAECNKIGGKWGQKSRAWLDEEENAYKDK